MKWNIKIIIIASLIVIISAIGYTKKYYTLPKPINVPVFNPYDDETSLDPILRLYKPEDVEKKDRYVAPLELTANDIRIEKDDNNEYYDLYVRKKQYINSILLTNYYWVYEKDKVRQYGLRSKNHIPINGDEKRLFKNQFIGKKQGLYFLTSTSVVKDKYFEKAFFIRIPNYVVYGYPNGKDIYGILKIDNNTKINIRTFSKKYADYKGSYKDNPIELNFKPIEELKDYPIIKKLQEINEDEYVAVVVQFEGKSHIFKSFLVKEESYSDEYEPIKFSPSTEKGHKQAVLLEALYYKGGKGKLVKAIIYFQKQLVPKTYYVSAVGKDDMGKYDIHSKGYFIKVEVPSISHKNYELSPYENKKDPLINDRIDEGHFHDKLFE